MSISFLLTVIIVLCMASLGFLLFPKAAPKRVVRKKVRKATAPAAKSPEPPVAKAPAQSTAPKPQSPENAIRAEVQKFVDQDPEATAKIIKGWLKSK